MSILMVSPPVVTVDDASKVASSLYGWHATAEALTGERDKNYLLRTKEVGDVVLKFINPGEEAAETDLQIQVLLWLEQQQCALQVPKALRNSAGALVSDYTVGEQTYKVRAYTYLDGVSVAHAQMSSALQQSFGECAAQLVRALDGFDHAALSRVLLWDVMHLNQLRGWAEEVLPRDDMGQFVFAFLDKFEQHILPQLQALPQQVIHGDISKSNTVVKQADATAINGVLDFGDLCKAPRVVELAVAASYALDAESGDLQAALTRIIAAYQALVDLSATEQALIPDLIIARLVQRIVISEWRASHFPNNRDYILRSNAQARQLLGRLMRVFPHQDQVKDTNMLKESASLEAMLAKRDVLGPAYRLFYEEPLYPVKGEGVWLTDYQGRRYLDAYNNVPVVGHCNPNVVAAMTAQASTLCTHTRYLHDGILTYADRLLAHFPSYLNRLMLTCTGSEANDLAIRIAEAVTGGTGVVVTSNAYHGVSHLLAKLSPSLAPIAEFVRVVAPPRASLDAADNTEEAHRFAADVAHAFEDLQAAGFQPCALLMDMIFASDGILPPTAGLLNEAAQATHAAGAVVIADEVQAGFGRTGDNWWGFVDAALQPDIVTMGKPMGNGYPIAGVVAGAEMVATFAAKGRYFNTFGGNPVAVATGVAVLDELEQRQLPAKAGVLGQGLQAAFAQAVSGLGVVEIRGKGLYWGIEIAADGTETATARATRITNHMRQNGVLLSNSGPDAKVLKIRPPLVFEQEHADMLVAALKQALQA